MKVLITDNLLISYKIDNPEYPVDYNANMIVKFIAKETKDAYFTTLCCVGPGKPRLCNANPKKNAKPRVFNLVCIVSKNVASLLRAIIV